MNTQVGILIIGALGLFLAIGLITWLISSDRRSRHLRARFGPEYDHELNEKGSRRRAEHELSERAHRVEKLPIHPLPAIERSRYAEMWNQQQARFVDDPPGAVHEADHLVEEVMYKRGYPVNDFEQRAADISVDHPRVVDNYRTAHNIAVRVDRGDVATEDLRRAMVSFRALFEELLEDRMGEARA